VTTSRRTSSTAKNAKRAKECRGTALVLAICSGSTFSASLAPLAVKAADVSVLGDVSRNPTAAGRQYMTAMPGRIESLRRSFEGLCVAHYAGVLRYLVAVSGDQHLAEDLAQETFLAAYRGLGRFEVGRDFSAYLRGIARNLYLKSLRGAAREAVPVVEGIDSIFERESASGIDGLEALERCIQRLGEEDRGLIEARYDRGVPLEEIAGPLGRSVSWAKVRLHRIRARLRRCIEDRMAAEAAT
jgi:RNA polymerase sigma-70 factor (ECF subfamily)